VAIGESAGFNTQGISSVAIGSQAGANTQGNESIAIGQNAGSNTQGNSAVAIGESAGKTIQGDYAVAVGYSAGKNNQADNSIILNATGDALDQTTANTFTVSPVRNDVANIEQVVFYNTTSKEITYGNTISVAGNVTGAYILGNGSQLTSLPVQTGTYGNSNVATFLGDFGSNAISTSGNITGNYFIGNGALLTSLTGSNVTGTVANATYALSAGNAVGTAATVTTNAQPNITSTGTLTSLTVTGDTTSGNLLTSGLISATGNATVGNLSVTGNITGNTAGFAIGYLNIPQVSWSANATIGLTDAGKHYYTTSASNLTLTIANSATANFSVGSAINFINTGTGTMSILQGSGVTLYLAGNNLSGNRTVSTFGAGTLQKVDTDTWFLVGIGLT